jgi:5,10-methylenetetrahydrofolate reductase
MESLYALFRRVAPRLGPVLGRLGEKRAERLLAGCERRVKGLLFDCRMCGECVLSATGMACPMNCGKQLRNGPCGGVTEAGFCEVDPELPCVWLEAGRGAGRMTGGDAIGRILPPVDRRRSGQTTWLKIIRNEAEGEPGKAEASALSQPGEPGSFEAACRSGRFLVTAEISPPDSVEPRDLLQRAGVLRGMVDALNVTDSAGANSHLSSMAAAALLAADGHTPVFQAACRDRNRIALQADLMGAAALGVANLLCLTGDGVGQGDQPQAKPVFDLDAVSLLGIARGMRDRGVYDSGRRIVSRPNLFLGATANPFAPPYRERVVNLEKKIDAGAQFIQTQFCFDLERLQGFLKEARDRGLTERCRILVGVGPLPSVRTARWLGAHVPGVYVPPPLIRRLEQAPDAKREGIRICMETIQALRGIEGVAGVHLMGHKNEAILAEIIASSGLAGTPARCAVG